MPNLRSTFASFCVAPLLASLSPWVSAECQPGDLKESEYTEQVGAFDIAMAARKPTDCMRHRKAFSRQSEPSGFRMSIDRGPFDAEYRWSRTANRLGERHGITFTPLERRDLLMRVHAKHELNRSSGTRRTSVKTESGFNVGTIRSTASLTREAEARRRVSGVELSAGGPLPGSALSAQVEYAEWHAREGRSEAMRRSYGAVAFEYACGDANLSTSYARKVDAAVNAMLHIYSAGAMLSRVGLGGRHHTVEFKAKLSKQSGGRATYAISLGGKQESSNHSPTAKIQIGRSESAAQYTRLSFTRSGPGPTTIHSGVEIKTGGGEKDAALTLAAKYRF